MVEVTAVHLVGGARHEHIADVRWTDPDTGATGESSRAAMVDFIEDKKGTVFVSDGQHRVYVGVVDAHPPYIRTYADGIWTDNLLALPRF